MMTMSALLQFPSSCHAPAAGHGGTTDGRVDARDDTTSNLLSFVDMASSNIKLALDKPVRSKRKVNHRKYLQKQLKRCGSSSSSSSSGTRVTSGVKEVRAEDATIDDDDDAGSSDPSTPPTPPPPAPPVRHTSVVVSHGQAACRAVRKDTTQSGIQNKSLAALFDPRTLHERCCTDPQPRSSGGTKVPLRQRNLPASFFTEPAARLQGMSQVPDASTPCAGREVPAVTSLTDPSQHPPDNHNVYYNEGVPYGQRSSCRHSQTEAMPDTVDRMLSGAPPEQTARRALNELLVTGESWSTAGDESGSRASASTTPCSSASGGFLCANTANPDLLEAALTAADVGRKSVLLSPAASPASSCGGAGVAWTGAAFHGGSVGRIGAVSPGDRVEESMTVLTTHHQGSSSRDSTPAPSPYSPPHMSTMESGTSDMYPYPASHYTPIPVPTTVQHHPEYHPLLPVSTSGAVGVCSPDDISQHQLEFHHQQQQTNQQPEDPRAFYHQLEDVRCGLPLPAAGVPPGEYSGYDPLGHSASAPFMSVPRHHHHPSSLVGPIDSYPRDPSAQFWQGTAVYGQVPTCYSYFT